jgi:hypothetical protein
MTGYVCDLTCYWEMLYGLHYKATPTLLCGYFRVGGGGDERSPCIRDDLSITQCRVLDKLRVAQFVKKISVLDFKLSPCSECCIRSLGWFPGVWIVFADVSEHYLYRNVGINSDAGESPKRKNTKSISTTGQIMHYRVRGNRLLNPWLSHINPIGVSVLFLRDL